MNRAIIGTVEISLCPYGLNRLPLDLLTWSMELASHPHSFIPRL